MANPWQRYQSPPAEETEVGPWTKYQRAEQATEPVEKGWMQKMTSAPMDGPKGQESLQYPMPEEGMYEGLTPKQSIDIYKQYSQSPNTEKGWFGGMTYKGEEVPSPVDYNPYTDFSDFTEFPGAKSVLGGITNTPKELLTTGLAAGEWLDQNLVDPENTGTKIIPRGSAAWVDQNMPEYETDGPVDALITEVAQAGVGGVMGAKAVAAGLKNLPRLFRAGASILATEGGASLTVDQDTDGLLIGDQGLVFQGLAIDPNGDYNEELLKKRINIFADAFLASKTAEKLGKSAYHLGKFTWDVIGKPMDEFLRESPKTQAIVREMADTLQGWHQDLTPEEQYQWRMKLADDIDKYSQIKGETGVEGIDDVDIRRDTMTAIERSIPNTKPGMAYKAKVSAMKTGQKGKGSPELEAATGRASRTLSDLNTQTEIVFGGDEGIQASKEAIQESGNKQVDAYKDEVDIADRKLTEADEDLTNFVQNDESMVQKLPSDYDSSTKLDVGKTKRVVADEVVDAVDEEAMTRTKNKNDLYAAIPEDAHVNTASLNDAIEKADKALDDKLRAKLGEASDNFKALQEFANFELTDAIDAAWTAGNKQRAKALEGLKRNLTEEQLDYLTVSGDQQTRDAAVAAKKYFVEEFAPYFRQGPGKKLAKMGVTTKQVAPDDYRTQSRQILKQNLDNPDAAEHTARVYELLEKKGNGSLLVDYAMGDVATDAQRIINSKGKLDPDDIVTLSSKLEKFGPLLEKSGHGKRVEDFLTKLRDRKFTKAQLQEKLTNLQQVAKEVEDQVKGEELKDFFKRSGTGFKELDDGYAIFSKIMDDPHRVNELKDLARRARGDFENPLAKDGMIAAFGKWSKQKFFKAGQDAGGAPLVNEQTYKNDFKQMMDVGQAILGNEYEPLLHVQEILMKEAGENSLSETQRAFRIGDIGASDQGMRDSVATLITFAFGTLDRTGARVRAASGRAITSMSKRSQAREIMDRMYANPDEFTKILREIARKDRVKISKQTKDQIAAMFAKGATFADYDDSERKQNKPLDRASRKSFQQTQRVFGEQ